MKNFFWINKNSISYLVECWFLNTPENKSPPIIPIKIKTTCWYKLSALIIDEFKKELLNPINDLLPGTSITMPCVKYTVLGDLVNLLNKLLMATAAIVPIKVLNKTPKPENNTVRKNTKTPVKTPNNMSFLRT